MDDAKKQRIYDYILDMMYMGELSIRVALDLIRLLKAESSDLNCTKETA